MTTEHDSRRYSRRAYLRTVATSLPILASAGCAAVVKTALLRTKQARKIFSPPREDHFLGGTSSVTGVTGNGVTLPVLHLTCPNYYSCGYHHAKRFAHIIRANVDSVYTIATRLIERKTSVAKLLSSAEKRSIVNCALDHAWAMMEPYVPQAEKDEMAGFADGLKAGGVYDVSLQTVHRIHAIPDLTETSCSALIAKGSATSDGHVYQLRILDYGAGSGLEKHPLLIVYHATRPDENTYVNVAWVGFLGLVSGMNARKVAISEMGMGSKPGETLAGEPMIFLLKQLMRYADSAEGGASIIRAAPRNNWYTYGIGDSTGGAIGMITSRYKCDVYPVNTFPSIDYGTHRQMPQFKDIMYAGHQNEKQCVLVERMKGSLNLASIQEMARGIRMDSNLHTVIYDLTIGDIWVANRTDNRAASDCPYVRFPFSAWATV